MMQETVKMRNTNSWITFLKDKINIAYYNQQFIKCTYLNWQEDQAYSYSEDPVSGNADGRCGGSGVRREDLAHVEEGDRSRASGKEDDKDGKEGTGKSWSNGNGDFVVLK